MICSASVARLSEVRCGSLRANSSSMASNCSTFIPAGRNNHSPTSGSIRYSVTLFSPAFCASASVIIPAFSKPNPLHLSPCRLVNLGSRQFLFLLFLVFSARNNSERNRPQTCQIPPQSFRYPSGFLPRPFQRKETGRVTAGSLPATQALCTQLENLQCAAQVDRATHLLGEEFNQEFIKGEQPRLILCHNRVGSPSLFQLRVRQRP